MPHLTVRRELEFDTLNSRVGDEAGGGGGEREKKNFLEGCPIREAFLREMLPHWPSIQIGNGRLQKFSHAMMILNLLDLLNLNNLNIQSYLVILLPKYFISFSSK